MFNDHPNETLIIEFDKFNTSFTMLLCSYLRSKFRDNSLILQLDSIDFGDTVKKYVYVNLIPNCKVNVVIIVLIKLIN